MRKEWEEWGLPHSDRVCDLRCLCSCRAVCAKYQVGSACMAGVTGALARQELLESPTAAAKLVKLLVFGAK